MNDRWWSHDSDTDLLTPGGDRGRDLANFFLELHRRGEKACVATAASPIADKGTLATQLISMRTEAAPVLVGAVSKSVETLSYAGLLVADLADDAEQAAMDVFTSLTGKGVPAAEAAKRTGLVYGIPKHALGGYIAKAAELKTPVPVLTDTADRLLFGYSQVIAETENEGEEEISKAYDPDEPRGQPGNKAQWVKRDPNIIVDYAIRDPKRRAESEARLRSDPGYAALAERDESIGRTKPRTSIEDLLARYDRVTEEPVQEKTEQVERLKAPEKLKAPKKLRAPKPKATSKLVPTKIKGAKIRAITEASKMSSKKIDAILPEPLKRAQGRDENFAPMAYPELEDTSPVTFSLTDAEFAALGKHMTSDRTIKLGTIERTSGRPGTYGTTRDEAEHLGNLGNDARNTYSPGPDSYELTARVFHETSDYQQASDLERHRMRQAAAERLVEDTLRDERLEFHGSDTAKRNEWRQVEFLPTVGGEGMAMLYRPSAAYVTDEEGNNFTASTPVVNEVRISDHRLRGIDNPGKHGGLELDPNQRIAMGHFNQADAHFDLESNTEIRTWHVTTDRHDEIGKAYNPAERRGQPGNRGQWASTPVKEGEKTEPVAPKRRFDLSRLDDVVVPTEKLRAPERLRAPKKLKLAPAKTEKLQPTKIKGTKVPVQLTGRSKLAFQREIARLQATSTDLAVVPLIQGHTEVSVLHSGEMNQILDILKDSKQGYLHVRDFLDDAGNVQGNDLNDNIAWLVSHPATDPDLDDDADHEMRYYMDGRVGTVVPGGQVHVQEHEPSPMEAEEMARALHDQVRRDPSIVHAWFVDDGRDPHDEFGRRYYTMLAAHDDRAPANDGDVLHIVVHDHTGNGEVGTITQLGPRRRWQNVPKGMLVGAKSQRYDGLPQEVSNPVVQLWTIHHRKATL